MMVENRENALCNTDGWKRQLQTPHDPLSLVRIHHLFQPRNFWRILFWSISLVDIEAFRVSIMSFQQYFICYFCFSLWRAFSSWVCLKALSIEISKLRPSKLTFTSKREVSISKAFSAGSQKDFDKRCCGAYRVGLSQSNEGSIWLI